MLILDFFLEILNCFQYNLLNNITFQYLKLNNVFFTYIHMCYNISTSILAQIHTSIYIHTYAYTLLNLYYVYTIYAYVPPQLPTYIISTYINTYVYIMVDFQQLTCQRSPDFYIFIYYKYIFAHFKDTKTEKIKYTL